jgi:hypothetical protein
MVRPLDIRRLEAMSEKRKIDDSELEEISGAAGISGQQIRDYGADPPDTDPPAGGIDRLVDTEEKDGGKE